jgi:hypothetical protein
MASLLAQLRALSVNRLCRRAVARAAVAAGILGLALALVVGSRSPSGREAVFPALIGPEGALAAALAPVGDVTLRLMPLTGRPAGAPASVAAPGGQGGDWVLSDTTEGVYLATYWVPGQARALVLRTGPEQGQALFDVDCRRGIVTPVGQARGIAPAQRASFSPGAGFFAFVASSAEESFDLYVYDIRRRLSVRVAASLWAEPALNWAGSGRGE